jgi:hypothetical protein
MLNVQSIKNGFGIAMSALGKGVSGFERLRRGDADYARTGRGGSPLMGIAARNGR